MHNYRLLVSVVIAVFVFLLPESLALAQDDYVLKEVLIIKNGRPQRLGAGANIKKYIQLKRGTESVSVRLGTPIHIDDSLTVNSGVNVKLELGRKELVWLNYNTVVHRDEEGIKLDDGEAYARVYRRFRLFGDRLRLLQTGTEFFLKVIKDSDMELLYVFDGKVVAINGTAQESVSKKKAVQAPNVNIIREVELEDVLYKPDIERIKKWRADLHWLELSWLGRLVRWPLRHPKISIGATALVTTTVVAYKIGQSDSELNVNVRF